MKQGNNLVAEDHGRSRLGRGLAALIADSSAQMPSSAEARDRRRVGIDELAPNPHNPRRRFSDEDLEELCNSIREKGVIQPILVRPMQQGGAGFEIIAGERRWRAAREAGLAEVPVLVVEVGDREALELAIIENVQRTDLNAIEEARGYERLAREFHYSHTDLARIIGKSRSHVANMLRLLKLPSSIETLLIDGSISAGHARALLSFDDPEPIARKIVARGLNVRDVERLAQAKAQPRDPAPVPPKRSSPSQDMKSLAQRLGSALGLAVDIETRGAGGEIRIRYETLDELESLCRQLTQ